MEIRRAISLVFSPARSFAEESEKENYHLRERELLLSSLNFGIYYYILYREGVSLQECCEENAQNLSLYAGMSPARAGEKIIRSYGMDYRYLVAKYQNEHVRKALRYVYAHLKEPLSLENVSAAVNVSRAHLCELFRKEVGCSFHAYVMNRRMKLARQLLQKTSDPVQRIAETCGFQSASYFSTAYRRYYGIAPGKERNRV